MVESARVQGKPRIVYLGSADEVLAKLSQTPAGQPIRRSSIGLVDRGLLAYDAPVGCATAPGCLT